MLNSKISLAFIILIIIIFVGIEGYMIISELSFIDALYMTIITVSTVGFQEVKPLGESGKVFTSCLIFVSIGLYAYSISIISEYIIKGNFIKELKYKKMVKKIKNLENHIIICGFGRNGRSAALRLKHYNTNFVIVDYKQEVLESVKNEGLFYVKGDATNDEILLDAGIMKAKYLISALPNDTDNLFVVLSSKQKNKDLRIVSKVQEESSIEKFKAAGAYNTIMPNVLGGISMASMILKPNVIEFWRNVFIRTDNYINIEEINVSDFLIDGHPASIKDLGIRDKYGCTVIGCKKKDGKYLVNPSSDTILESGECVIVIGSDSQIKNIKIAKK